MVKTVRSADEITDAAATLRAVHSNVGDCGIELYRVHQRSSRVYAFVSQSGAATRQRLDVLRLRAAPAIRGSTSVGRRRKPTSRRRVGRRRAASAPRLLADVGRTLRRPGYLVLSWNRNEGCRQRLLFLGEFARQIETRS
jgi:hypothetical protein